jgi:hypothetical protein
MNNSIKSTASLAAVLGMAFNLHGHSYPRNRIHSEPTTEDILRTQQKRERRAETKKRRKQKHKR